MDSLWVTSRVRSSGKWALRLTVLLLAIRSIDACLAPTAASPSTLVLEVHLDSVSPFEDAPRYYVIELRNTGKDTLWVAPFSLASEDLEGFLYRDGTALQDWGIIADVAVTSPNWRGVSVPPSSSVFDVGILQDRWGDPSRVFEGIYQGRHLGQGNYRFNAIFHFAVTGPGLIESSSTRQLTITPRTAEEDSLLERILSLVAMGEDSAASSFDSTVSAYIATGVAKGGVDPFLPVLAFRISQAATVWGHKATAGQQVTLDSSLAVIAELAKDRPEGAFAVLGLLSSQPGMVRALVPHLGSSLAGRFAQSIIASSGSEVTGSGLAINQGRPVAKAAPPRLSPTLVSAIAQ